MHIAKFGNDEASDALQITAAGQLFCLGTSGQIAVTERKVGGARRRPVRFPEVWAVHDHHIHF